ncbi:GNAT family N-acetyltransferase [Salinicoccus halitifaciens]|uniref:N-acetylglutamate synthase-like GNAT family acetyltransferase n=1 Tax=Salinicoccus halitifaciens TaxID=1073415 RepID=A0ABV2EBT8_9STAP|nr:GNAT family N-acetyltransferase [Salinicoccus halitifaciens]MCD2137442.1 GNAT family N-acetyltransferase [Salinicoccus halitifaciens]
MIHLSTERGISKEALLEFYSAKQIKKYENRDDALYEAVVNSDYIVTAWDGHRLVGIIRSSGDHIFTQYINNILIHDDYLTKGIGSKMMDMYLEETREVMDLYMMSGRKVAKAFTINWFEYRGFKRVAEVEGFQVFHRRQK